MADINLTLRRQKATHLTIDEVDANFTNLKNAIIAQSDVFVHNTGDTMTGNLTIEKSHPLISLNNTQNAYSTKFGLHVAGDNFYVLKNDPEVTDVANGWDSIYALELRTSNSEGYIFGNKIWHTGNDGPESGLDADSVDGQHLTDLDARYVNVSGDTMTGNLVISKTTPSIELRNTNPGYLTSYLLHVSSNNFYILKDDPAIADAGNGWDPVSAFELRTSDNQGYIFGNKIWTTGNDGVGSGLDADTVDGKHASDFALATHNHDDRYYTKTQIDNNNYTKLQVDNILTSYYTKTQSNDRFALINHIHTEYAPASHTHNEYAPISHTHTEYAPASHTHNEFSSYVTLTGVQTVSNKTFASYKEKVHIVNDLPSTIINPNNGPIQLWTLGGNRSVPASGFFDDGQSVTLMIEGGSYTINWPVGTLWKTNSGTAPTLNATGRTAIQLWMVDGTLYGARVGDN